MLGDLLLAPATPAALEIRGLALGRGTAYPISSIEGLGQTATRSSDAANPDDDGARAPGPDLLEPRQLLITLGIVGDDAASLGPLTDALLAAWAPVRRGTIEMALWQRGWPKQLIRGRTRRAPRPSAFWEAHGQSELVLEFWAPDPYLYALEEVATPLQLAAAATSVELQDLAVAGNARTRPIVEIQGPARDPVVTISRPDGTTRALRFDVDLAAGQTLIADVAARSITIDGAAAFSARATDLEWAELQAGLNDVVFSRSPDALTGAAANLTIRHRAAWSG